MESRERGAGCPADRATTWNTDRCYSRHRDPAPRSGTMTHIERDTADAHPSHVVRRSCVAAVLVAVSLAFSGPASGQISSEPGARIWTKLQQAQLLDAYYPDAVRQIAETLAQAAPGVWRGVQVNTAWRAGWLNIYLIDATRLR